MSRRRYISSDISTDPKVAELAEYGLLPSLLYTWAIPHMDDWGRITGDPRKFKLLVCPALDVSVSDVETALDQIAAVGLWVRYQVEGRWYIAVPESSWFKYQSYINKTKRSDDSGSDIPAPPESLYKRKVPQFTEEERIPAQKAVSPSPSPSPSPSLTPTVDLSVVASNDQSLLGKNAEDSSQNIAAATAAADKNSENNIIVLQNSLRRGGILTPSGFEIDRLLSWHKEGVEMDAICYAIEKAAIAGIRRVSYIEGILKSWSDNGIYTKYQALEADSKFELEKNRGGQVRSRGDPAGITPSSRNDKKKEFIRSLYV